MVQSKAKSKEDSGFDGAQTVKFLKASSFMI